MPCVPGDKASQSEHILITLGRLQTGGIYYLPTLADVTYALGRDSGPVKPYLLYL